MRRTVSILLCLLLMCAAIPAGAMSLDSYYQLIHIDCGPAIDVMTIEKTDDINWALSEAESGDIIEVFDDAPVSGPIIIPANLEITIASGCLRKEMPDGGAVYGRESFEYTDENAPARTLQKNFSGSMFVLESGSKLTLKNIIVSGNSDNSTQKGGLFYAKSGSELNVNEKVTLKNSVLGSNAQGSVIYAEAGSAIKLNAGTFSGNSGSAVYAKSVDNVTIAGSVNVSTYFEDAVASVCGMNVVLSGEIGVVFYADVPDVYKSGSIRLECRSGQTKNFAVADCSKNADGKYTVSYELTAVQMSEPVKVTVFDKNGNVLAQTSKSLAGYADVIVNSTSSTADEKTLVKSLINYGHYAQLSCAKENGWTIGEKYAETKAYYAVKTADSELDKYAITKTGKDNSVRNIGVSASLDYKTDLNIYFYSTYTPNVSVNGSTVQAVKCSDGRYKVTIGGIGALNLADRNTVIINSKTTLSLSALGYCTLAMKESNPELKNAAKALYEFYVAAENYTR